MAWPECVPVLFDTAAGVVLRPHAESDLEAIVQQCRDPEFLRWTTIGVGYGIDDARQFVTNFVPAAWKAGTAAYWAIEAPGVLGPGYLGTVDVQFDGDGRGNFGAGLHPRARGHGMMSAAARMVRDWAFDVARLRALRWEVIVGNWPSRRVAAAIGMRDEGVRRAWLNQRGELCDAWTATMLREDPRTSLSPRRLPELAVGALTLRGFTETDLVTLVAAYDDPRMHHWMPEVTNPFDRDAAVATLAWCREGEFTGTRWAWCVADADDRCVGGVTAFRLDDVSGNSELGYWAHPTAWGHRYTSAATRRVADYLLAEGGRETLTILAARENHRSQAVARNAGFTETGYHAQAERLGDGTRTDLVCFSRVREC